MDMLDKLDSFALRGSFGGNTHSVPIGLWCLSTAEVAQSPCGIAEHAQLPAITDQIHQRTEGIGTQHKVTALGAVTSNVTQRPDRLFPDIRLGAAEKLDEDRHSTGFDDNLCLLSRSGGNVGQGPSSLKLNQGMCGPEEFHKTAHDARLDNTLNGRVAFLGKQLPEFGCALDLRLNLVGENALDHLREFHIELEINTSG